ncbi:MAG TPA: DUF1385 domain-containing protein [Chthonomonadaceae bacterium]|nr:DUF1385 domain-containing protein [Chthonomonadaceae bacterium]
MAATPDLFILPLRALLRPAPLLAPEDSLARFLQVTRQEAVSTLPVLQRGYLCGMVSLTDVLPILEARSQAEREAQLRQPVSALMRPPEAVAHADMSPAEIGQVCARHGMSLVPVVDSEGYCLGIVRASDLLLSDQPMPRPALIGGMATPFGVYLTNGTIQAGASNLALVGTGMLMGLLMLLSYKLVSGGIWLAQHYAHLPRTPMFDLADTPPAGQFVPGLVSLGLQGLVLLLFLLLLRATGLAGYHAAEHQTVHAIEREETLAPEVVRRMPRAHPRCGTNLVGAVVLFGGLWQALESIPYVGDFALVFAGLATLFTWRTFGTFLQERFTTKPASDRQIASGIAAGEELLEKYLHSAPARARLYRRIWCMGLLQIMVGSSLMLGSIQLLSLTWGLWKH